MNKYKLIYGRGQINHIRGIIEHDTRQGIMFFSKHEPGEIGRLKELTADRLENAPIVMIFENVNGLDVLINELTQLRAEMLGEVELNPLMESVLGDVIDLDGFSEPKEVIDKEQENE